MNSILWPKNKVLKDFKTLNLLKKIISFEIKNKKVSISQTRTQTLTHSDSQLLKAQIYNQTSFTKLIETQNKIQTFSNPN